MKVAAGTRNHQYRHSLMVPTEELLATLLLWESPLRCWGANGFEPTCCGIKIHCFTTWGHPNRLSGRRRTTIAIAPLQLASAAPTPGCDQQPLADGLGRLAAQRDRGGDGAEAADRIDDGRGILGRRHDRLQDEAIVASHAGDFDHERLFARAADLLTGLTVAGWSPLALRPYTVFLFGS
jgi:hypothetical protein